MDKKKNENFFLKLVKIKKAIRELCTKWKRPGRCREKLWYQIL